MPEEIFIIVIVSIMIGGGLSLARTITTYLLTRQKKGDLTSSELSRLITSAVDESVQPLKEQVARLEQKLLSAAPEKPRISAREESDYVVSGKAGEPTAPRLQ